MDGIKIFHVADVHLDAPFSLSSAAEAERCRNSLRSAFASALLTAKMNGAKLFLVSGDLFDGSFVTKDTEEFLIEQFGKYRELKVFISPGNHDPFNAVSPYSTIKFPENVHVFKDKERVSLPELGVDVYGFGFTESSCSACPVLGYPELDKEKINILVCHGDTSSPLSTYGPITKADIAASGFDYVALGHIHKASGVLCEGGVSYAYPGCIEGRGFDETGYKGGLSGTVSKGEVSLNPVTLSKHRFEIATVSLDGVCSRTEALERIRSGIRSYNEDTSLRLILEGQVAEGFIITPDAIGKGYEFPSSIEIIDKTFAAPSFTSLEQSNTLTGVFYKKMIEEIEKTENGSEEREVLISALRYGLAALGGRSLADE